MSSSSFEPMHRNRAARTPGCEPARTDARRVLRAAGHQADVGLPRSQLRASIDAGSPRDVDAVAVGAGSVPLADLAAGDFAARLASAAYCARDSPAGAARLDLAKIVSRSGLIPGD